MITGNRCCPNLQRWLTPALFKALGDQTRLGLLAFLADGGGERTVSELGGCCPVDLSVVSRHLRVLRDAGVVEARKQGKEVFYRVRSTALAGILRGLADALEEACGQPREAVKGTDVGQVAPSGGTT
jgi:ArsR family transcriptional regulator